MNAALERLMADLPAERRALYARLLVFLIALLVPITLGSSLIIFNDGDVSWHIAAGRWIVEHRTVPQVDPFSFTFGGKPWVAFEWLSQVVYASAFALAGYGGVAAVVTIALIVLHVAVVRQLAERLSPLAVVVAVIAMDMVLVPFMLARPHVLAWPIFAIWLAILLRAREKGEAPPIVAALLITLWINLHGSWAIGLALAAIFALEAMIDSRWERRQLVGWLLFGIASLAAATLNANGLNGLLHPLAVSQFRHLPLIQEWRPSNPNVTPIFYAIFLLTLAAILWRGARLSAVRALLLAGIAALAFLQVRHQALLAISAAVILPAAFAKGERRPLFKDDALRRKWLGAGAAFAVLAVIARIILPLEPEENDSNPRGLIAAIPPELRDKPMINNYSFGGPLILAGVRPFIDGRSDMYGDAFMANFKRIHDGDRAALEKAIARWNICWTMSANSQSKLVSVLDRLPGWRRVHADKVGVLHARDCAAEPVSVSGSPRANP